MSSSPELLKRSTIAFPDLYVCLCGADKSVIPEGYNFRIFCREIYAARVQNGVILDTFRIVYDCNDMFLDEQVPSCDTAFSKLISFIRDLPVVGYNNSSDFLPVVQFADRRGIPFSSSYIDCMRIARKSFPDRKHHRLHDVAEYTGVDFSELFKIPYDDSAHLPYVCQLTVKVFEALKRITK